MKGGQEDRKTGGLRIRELKDKMTGGQRNEDMNRRTARIWRGGQGQKNMNRMRVTGGHEQKDREMRTGT